MTDGHDRRARCAQALAAWLAAAFLFHATAGAGEPTPKPDRSKPDEGASKSLAEPKPLCRVVITNNQGFSLKGLLIAFEKGVYRVRDGEGTERSLAEDELRAVRFAPLGESDDKPRVAKPPKKPKERPEAHKPAEPNRLWFRQLAEKRRQQTVRLKQLHKSGRLDEYVHGLKSRLRSAGNVLEAAAFLSEINMAQRLQTGGRLSPEQTRKLINSIQARHVRQSAEDILRMLRRLGDPSRRPGGPRKPGGERPPPRRDWR